jgi:hypothetical protein
MVSYKFDIPDEKHPFHELNNAIGSVDVKAIVSKDFDKDDVSLCISQSYNNKF